MFLKGKILVKLHNCFFCHKIFNNFSIKNFLPKIKKQYFSYLFWSLKQYKNYIFRKNFFMKSQIQNISIFDIKKIFFFINNL